MAYFAKMSGTKVTTIVVISDSEAQTEAQGIEFCKSLFGEDTDWLQCSYDGSIRKNYPGAGYDYDESRDAFIAPRPTNDYLLDEATCQWYLPDIIGLSVDKNQIMGDGIDEVILTVRGKYLEIAEIQSTVGNTLEVIEVAIDTEEAEPIGTGQVALTCSTPDTIMVLSYNNIEISVMVVAW